jgi:hypothetical protein
MAFARQLPPDSRPCSFVDTPALIVARLMPARPGLRVTLRRPQLVIAALRQRPFRSRGKLGLILYSFRRATSGR